MLFWGGELKKSTLYEFTQVLRGNSVDDLLKRKLSGWSYNSSILTKTELLLFCRRALMSELFSRLFFDPGAPPPAGRTLIWVELWPGYGSSYDPPMTGSTGCSRHPIHCFIPQSLHHLSSDFQPLDMYGWTKEIKSQQFWDFTVFRPIFNSSFLNLRFLAKN